LPTGLSLEVLSQFAVRAERKRPIDYADPKVGVGIVGPDLNVSLMVRLRFGKKVQTQRLSRQLEQERAQAIHRGNILRVQFEDALEFLRSRAALALFSSLGAPGMYSDA
jgi:hypothetical protein